MLVSVIIPTYNRAHLISETLDSILKQTYTNWECIIVDDGSTDNTDVLVQTYTAKDSRFKYYKRQENMTKGANSCRNYGFEKSSGAYINWFDSDDLMMPDFIEAKLNFMEGIDCDFIFSNTINFGGNTIETPLIDFDFNEIEINSENFIKQKLVWCTPDFFATKKSIGDVRFNQELKSGQEYNFFSRYLTNPVKGKHLNKILTKRRVHDNSIQGDLGKEKKTYRVNKYNVYLKTYQDVKSKANKESLENLLNLSMGKAFEMTICKERVPEFFTLIGYIIRDKGFLSFLSFSISLIFAYLFKSGYALMNYSRGK